MDAKPPRRNICIAYDDWAAFDPSCLRPTIGVDAAAIDLGAVYTFRAEHAETLYLWLGCEPEPAGRGQALFDLAKASCLVAGPRGWTGGALWPTERDDQPPGTA